jgi:hypothetical protein
VWWGGGLSPAGLVAADIAADVAAAFGWGAKRSRVRARRVRTRPARLEEGRRFGCFASPAPASLKPADFMRY